MPPRAPGEEETPDWALLASERALAFALLDAEPMPLANSAPADLPVLDASPGAGAMPPDTAARSPAAWASRSSGSSLASSASSGASGWSAYTSGSHLGQQFASGIGSAWNSVRSFATSLVNAAKSVMGFSVPEDGPWSGAEKGGETSGRHLGENFAHGMLEARADVRDSAKRLMATAQLDGNVAYTGNGGTKTTVVNNYYSLGDVKIDASSISEFMTLNDFFQTVRKAKAGM